MNLKTSTPLLFCGLAAALLLPPSTARAVVTTDNFGTAKDYALGDTAGTIWNGMHNIPLIAGTGQFQATGGVLRVSTAPDGAAAGTAPNLGWEGNRSTAPFLYRTVPAGQDFTATVKISAQNTGQWSAAGLIARAFNATPPGALPDALAQNYATMFSFRTNVGVADEGVTLMKRIQAGLQLNDLGIGINTTPAPVPGPNIAPLPILVRMQKVAGGLTYRGFVSTDNGATWQFQSRIRPDAGNPLRDPAIPMEVGLSFMNFSTLVATADMDDFVLDTHNPLPAPGVPAIGASTNITLTRGNIATFNLSDLTGLNTQPMSWNLIADAANPATPPTATTIRATPALLPGAGGATALTQGGKPALADALGAPLPLTFAQNGSTTFRWNTAVMQAVAPNVLPAQPWALGTYRWTIRATNDWLQVSNDHLLTITLIPEPSTVALGSLALATLAGPIRRRRR